MQSAMTNVKIEKLHGWNGVTSFRGIRNGRNEALFFCSEKVMQPYLYLLIKIKFDHNFCLTFCHFLARPCYLSFPVIFFKRDREYLILC